MKTKSIRKKYFFYIFVFFFSVSLFGEDILLTEKDSKKGVIGNLEVFNDKSGLMEIDDVINAPFEELNKTDLPPSEKGVHWLRFSVLNKTRKHVWILEHNYFRSGNSLTLFIPQTEGGYLNWHDSSNFLYNKEEIFYRNPAYSFSITPGKKSIFYIMLKNKRDVYLEFNIWTPGHFFRNNRKEQLFYGFFTGALFIIIIYNIFLFFSFKDNSYIYYILFVFCLLILQLNNHSILGEIFTPIQNVDYFISDLFKGFVFIFYLLFTREYLLLKKHNPIMSMLLNILLICSVLFWVGGTFNTLLMKIYKISLGAGGIFSLYAAIYVYKSKNYKPAIYFLTALTFVIISGLLIILPEKVTMPISNIFYYLMDISSILTICLFAIGLSNKIKLIRLEKEAARKESIKTLHDADKLKNEFLANTSHEMRNPLHGIISLTDSLISGITGKLPREAMQRLKIISASSNRLYRLVDDLLDMTRINNNELSLTIKTVDLYSVLTQALALIKPQADHKRITLINDVLPQLKPVYADEDRVFQIIYNLLGNGVKFTQSGYIEVSGEVHGDFVSLVFQDSGEGIPEDKLETIFNPFEQADGSERRVHEGLGLGLSISRQLAELQGGSLTVRPTEKEGACFVMTLKVSTEPTDYETRVPILKKQNYPVILEGEYPVSPDMKKKHDFCLLLVDDDPVNIQILIDQLSSENYKIYSASNGTDALGLIKKKAEIDVVILDVMMPGLSGYDVCKEIRKEYEVCEKPVLLLTAKNRVPDIVTGLNSGANDFLTIPYQKTELVTRIATLCGLRTMVKSIDMLKKLNKTRADVADMALHDLKSPLTVVSVYARRLRKNLVLDDLHKDQLQSIIDSTEEIMGAIREFLEKNNFEDDGFVLDLQPGNFLQIITDSIDSMDELAKQKGQKILFQYNEEEEFYVKGDSFQLTKVIKNLISNAIKFSEPSRIITLELTYDEGSSESKMIHLNVKDQGPGLKEEDLAKIFLKPSRLSAKPTGGEDSSGYGLWGCKKIIELHGGSIKAQNNTTGPGAVFVIKIPALEP